MDDVVLCTETDLLLTSQISFIVEDDNVMDPELTYYILLEKLGNLLPADLGEWHCLDPIG